MRVLMITDVYFPRINGVSTSIRTFRQELDKAGVETALVAPAYDTAWADDPETRRIASRRVPFDPEDRLMRGREVAELERTLAGGGFDLVHVHTPFVAHRAGVRLGRALKLPVVETYHTHFEAYFHHYVRFLPQRWLQRGARRLSRGQCNDVDAVVVPSSAMRSVLDDYGVTTPTHVIPTGIRLAAFWGGDGDRFRSRHGIAVNRPVLVHVGRAAHEKNIGFLLEVTARLHRDRPDVLLVIAGEGPALPSLKQRARALGIEANVLFVGYLDRDTELRDCYRAGNVFVFSSRTETQGLVLLEALALGIPVVSTAVLGTRDVLLDAQGAVVVPEEVERFADAVESVIDDPVRHAELSQGALADAEGWSAEAMTRRLLALYQSLVRARGREVTISRRRGGDPGAF